MFSPLTMRIPVFLTSLLICGVVTAQDTATPAGSFARLSFDFCAAAVSQPGRSVPDLVQSLPGLRLKGPEPFEQATKPWTKSLQFDMKADADTPTWTVITEAASTENFHLAYAREDGAACVVIAQDIPSVAALTLERLASDPAYRLWGDGAKNRIYMRHVAAPGTSFFVVAPKQVSNSGIERVVFRRDAGVRAPVVEADRQRWAGEILRVCIDAARRKHEPVVEEFGEFMEWRPRPDGKGGTIGARQGFPATVLFAEAPPKAGCKIALTDGAEENRQVIELWRSGLRDLGAKPGVGARGAESFTIPKTRGEKDASAVRVEISAADPLLPMRMISVQSD